MKKTYVLGGVILIVIILILAFVSAPRYVTQDARYIEVQEIVEGPSSYLDSEYGFSFQYRKPLTVGGECKTLSSVVKQVTINSSDPQDAGINPVACMYIGTEKFKADLKSEKVSFGNREVMRYETGVAGADLYLYEILLKSGQYLYFEIYKPYVTKQSVTFEDTPYYDHFVRLGLELDFVRDTFTLN